MFLDLQTGKPTESLISSFYLQGLIKNLDHNRCSKNIELVEWNEMVTGKTRLLWGERIFIIPQLRARYDPYLVLQTGRARVL